MTSESSFQSYFLKQMPHCYRTALTTGGGFPDCLAIKGEQHSFIELKLLKIGPSGDRKLKSLFKPTQPPWYMEYLKKGGKRLYVVFRKEEGYGILHVDEEFVRQMDTITYSMMKQHHRYLEYKVLKEMIDAHFA